MQAGNPEEVQRLRQAAEALQAKLSQGDIASGGPQPGNGREARLQHLRAAADHLEAAGADGEAQHVMQLIQRIQEGSGEGRSRSDGTRPSQDRRQGSTGRATPTGGSPPNVRENAQRDVGRREPGLIAGVPVPRESANAQAVQELRTQIEQMHREIRELREELNRVKSSGEFR